MAAELGGVCLAAGSVRDSMVGSAHAIVWEGSDRPRRAPRNQAAAPQILDVHIPPDDQEERSDLLEACREFRFLLTSTQATREYLGSEPEEGWRSWIVPHHHNNPVGFVISEDRIESPRVVGFVGGGSDLHDPDAIESQIKKLSLVFMRCEDSGPSAYEHIDIGIAWTRPHEIRDRTLGCRTMVNLVSRGIPCVLPEYDSYRDADAALGGGAAVIRSDLPSWLEGLGEIVGSEAVRREIWSKASAAQRLYSRKTIGNTLLSVVEECRFEPNCAGP
jgi:hypothetical protein